MSKKEDAIQSANIAIDNQPDQQQALDEAQGAYDGDVQALRDFEVQDYYSDLKATNIDLDSLQKIDPASTRFQGQAGQARLGNLGSAQGYEGEGYSARGTNVGNLQRGSATALAAAAAKSKQGISADIDRQVKSNEQLRAQGEQGLQRDMLAQGNLASQFNLGQSQFNVGAQNQASQFGASARNQAAQFGAGAANQFALSRFSAENQMNQFNTSQSNAERMAEFGALQNANALNASAVNSAISQNASNQNSFDMGRAGGQAQADAARYGQNVDIAGISSNALNNEQERSDQDDQIIAQGQSASNKRDKWQKFWGSGKYNSKYDPNSKRYQGKAYDDSNDYKG